jgi:hypothetical protein
MATKWDARQSNDRKGNEWDEWKSIEIQGNEMQDKVMWGNENEEDANLIHTNVLRLGWVCNWFGWRTVYRKVSFDISEV